MKQTLITRLENSFLKYATGVLLLVIPLYPKFPLFSVPGTYVSVRLEDILLAAIMFFWFLVILHRRTNLFRDPIFWSVMIFFGSLFLSTVDAIFVTKTVVPYISALHSLRRVEYLSVLFLAASAITSKENLAFLLKLIFLSGLTVALYGFGQKFFSLPVVSTMNREFSQGLALTLGVEARVNSTFAGHYDLAAYLVTLLVMAIGAIVLVKDNRNKVLTFGLFGALLWSMIASASRISFFAYLAPGALMLAFLKRWKLLVPVVVVSLTMAAFSSNLTSRYLEIINVTVTQIYERYLASQPTPSPSAIAILLPSPSPVVSAPGTLGGKVKPTPRPRRIRPTPTPVAVPVVEDRSMAIRLNVEWPRAIRSFVKNPIFGTGPSSITLSTDNDYLRSLGESGLLGSLAFLNVFLQIAIVVKNLLRKSAQTMEGMLGWTMTFGTLGLAANALFIDVFEASKVAISYWLLVGIWIGTARLSAAGKTK